MTNYTWEDYDIGDVPETDGEMYGRIDSGAPATEYIIWGVLAGVGEPVQYNVMGTGYRFALEEEARRIAQHAANKEDENAQRATDGNIDIAIFLIPCPSGEMPRDEAQWERIFPE